MALCEGFEAHSIFNDTINFPYGFNRSGHFNIRQAELLKVLGTRLRELDKGKQDATNDVEAAFIQFCKGEKTAETDVEKLWMKYKDISENRQFHSLTGASTNSYQREDSLEGID